MFTPHPSAMDTVTNDEVLPGGVTKRTITKTTQTWRRVIGGIISIGLTEVIMNHTVESIQYLFDGEYLGVTKNQAADNAHQKALKLCEQGNFEQAEKWSTAAYHTCDSGYSAEEIYRNNMTATGIAVEGLNLRNNRKFSEAQAKWEEAYNLSNVNTLRNYRDAAQTEVAKIEAEKEATEEKAAAETTATEERVAKLTAEKKAAEEKVVYKEQIEKVLIEKQVVKQYSVDKVDVEGTTTTVSRWKKAAEKHATEQSGEKIAARWREIAEALRINEEGLKLYREGKLKEAAVEIESALDMYEKAVSKFSSAAKIKALDIIFNSFVMVIAAFIKNKAYNEAQETIDYAKGHFSDKTDAFTEAERLIASDDWSPNYTHQYLVKLDQQLLENNNIMEHSDGY
ncbi:unnamed protein product [Didymodactylos carnosus]|uniref:Uncharacterized protein n=1 Tax=Didymodactylos carnosus TaxID=1234261 RepID=A0A8S2T059_9BILA|nr:unnamed protein product [Didymodactylos carnosus]CAF4253842.1 unnamed protein product [Didymodactylos carnosus]